MGIPWDGMGWDWHELQWNGMGWDRKICPMDKRKDPSFERVSLLANDLCWYPECIQTIRIRRLRNSDPPKKGLQFRKPPFSATFIHQIKNNTTLFIFILKFKDLSEIYLGGCNYPPAPHGYVSAGDVTMITS